MRVLTALRKMRWNSASSGCPTYGGIARLNLLAHLHRRWRGGQSSGSTQGIVVDYLFNTEV